MASAEFDDASEEKRPTVQVGDPFTEKLLLEACLELMATDAIIGIQDMGAAGLTSSSCEMADKGGSGIELNLDKVPCREKGMTPYEMMLSESQERMLMVLKPGREAEAEKIFRKWELDFAVIGITTDTKRLVLKFKGETVADIPVAALADEAPLYERPWVEPEHAKPLGDVPESKSVSADLAKLVGSPDLASRRWIYEQYDSTVMADTVQKPGGDAAIVRIHRTNKAIAVKCDVTPRYVQADPFVGGQQAVAEVWRNITAVGAVPLAITDNLNFGNPQKPEIMGQFVMAVRGIGEACRGLDFPVVSGNVSLYNETNGQAILPTPAIGGVGLMKDVTKHASVPFKSAGETLLVIGDTRGHLGQSIYVREILGREEGAAPAVDLKTERRNGDFVRGLISAGRVTTVHDVSDGGLAVALAEMAMSSGIGATVVTPKTSSRTGFWFGEDQARYVLAVPSTEADRILSEAKLAGVPALKIGETGGTALVFDSEEAVPVATLKAAHEEWLPKLMAS
jgi:phosphoribosylformylglycinamidine synthase